MKKREIAVTSCIVLLFLCSIYIATLPYTWIFQIEIVAKLQSLVPKPCFYIENTLGASLIDGEANQVIDDNLKASLTRDGIIYAIGHRGFYVADIKNKTIKIVPTVSGVEYYQKNHYLKTGKNNVKILTESVLSEEEKEIRKSLIEAAYSQKNFSKDIEVYMWQR